MRRQIRGLTQGANNIQDGISLCQVADGALDEVDSMLQRANELAIEASNGTLTSEDRSSIQQEVNHIVAEIDRISKTTTFNEQQIFVPRDIEIDYGSITKLIESPSTDFGYLHEAYYDSGNSSYFPAAYLSFKNINSDNINLLNDGNFTFNCSINCGEVFDIKFKTDGTPSSASNLTGQVHHYYTVDISDCNDGRDIVNKIYSYVGSNLPSTASSGSYNNIAGIKVSHSNNLIQSSDGWSLIVASNYQAKNTAADAASAYPRSGFSSSGAITCSTVKAHNTVALNKFRIQCSSSVDDYEWVRIKGMSSEIMDIDPLDVKDPLSAEKTINKVKSGLDYIKSQESLWS